jgi:hypothetical protein
LNDESLIEVGISIAAIERILGTEEKKLSETGHGGGSGELEKKEEPEKAKVLTIIHSLILVLFLVIYILKHRLELRERH